MDQFGLEKTQWETAQDLVTENLWSITGTGTGMEERMYDIRFAGTFRVAATTRCFEPLPNFSSCLSNQFMFHSKL